MGAQVAQYRKKSISWLQQSSGSTMNNSKLSEQFGDIDIYLFDQLLKGRFDDCKQVLDLGCGKGRNSHYFLLNGFEVYGIDPDEGAIAATKTLAAQLAPNLPASNFVVDRAERMPFADASFDLIIYSAVLHFAHNKIHFEQMLQAAWRVLKPGGFFFARLASSISIETLITPAREGRYALPDGTVRYLVSYDDLVHYTRQLNATLYEPIKTTNVSNLRAMTTWCMQK
jgi:tellurite methyltransferase